LTGSELTIVDRQADAAKLIKKHKSLEGVGSSYSHNPIPADQDRKSGNRGFLQ